MAATTGLSIRFYLEFSFFRYLYNLFLLPLQAFAQISPYNKAFLSMLFTTMVCSIVTKYPVALSKTLYFAPWL